VFFKFDDADCVCVIGNPPNVHKCLPKAFDAGLAVDLAQ